MREGITVEKQDTFGPCNECAFPWKPLLAIFATAEAIVLVYFTLVLDRLPFLGVSHI